MTLSAYVSEKHLDWKPVERQWQMSDAGKTGQQQSLKVKAFKEQEKEGKASIQTLSYVTADQRNLLGPCKVLEAPAISRDA